MEQKHTPLPWHWAKARTMQHLHDTKNSCFAQISMPIWATVSHGENDMREQYKADAEFIVRACNSHYELLEALKHLARYEAFSDSSWYPAIKAAQEAIAKAEGK